MPPKASITITLQEDMLVATTLAGNVVLRSGEVDMPGHQLKNAVTQELGHASFLMVIPEAEKLVAGAKGIAEQNNSQRWLLHGGVQQSASTLTCIDAEALQFGALVASGMSASMQMVVLAPIS